MIADIGQTTHITCSSTQCNSHVACGHCTVGQWQKHFASPRPHSMKDHAEVNSVVSMVLSLECWRPSSGISGLASTSVSLSVGRWKSWKYNCATADIPLSNCDTNCFYLNKTHHALSYSYTRLLLVTSAMHDATLSRSRPS